MMKFMRFALIHLRCGYPGGVVPAWRMGPGKIRPRINGKSEGTSMRTSMVKGRRRRPLRPMPRAMHARASGATEHLLSTVAAVMTSHPRHTRFYPTLLVLKLSDSEYAVPPIVYAPLVRRATMTQH